jgi:hypothetical protein
LPSGIATGANVAGAAAGETINAEPTWILP